MMLNFILEDELISFLKTSKKNLSTIGFVPTMGALHDGHLSLIEKASAENKTVVVSIFVNPIQFDNATDLEKYPKTLDQDIAKIKSINPNTIIFTPNKDSIFKHRTTDTVYNFDGIETQMEGAFRKNHFNGVATIVKILFEIVQPNKAYFGEKDFQQLQIVKKLVQKENLPVTIIGCSIVREKNGLAMSSRNERLSTIIREESKIIFVTLSKAKELFLKQNNSIPEIKDFVIQQFEKRPKFNLEYFEIAEVDTLQPHYNKQKNCRYRAFIAVVVENIRLIDNISLN